MNPELKKEIDGDEGTRGATEQKKRSLNSIILPWNSCRTTTSLLATGKDFSVQEMIIATNTSKIKPNYLMLLRTTPTLQFRQLGHHWFAKVLWEMKPGFGETNTCFVLLGDDQYLLLICNAYLHQPASPFHSCTPE